MGERGTPGCCGGGLREHPCEVPHPHPRLGGRVPRRIEGEGARGGRVTPRLILQAGWGGGGWCLSPP
ncbi:hypothetical protein T484DRAFT_1956892 [Baffinella frigidus]|nr:hypothetical protein T484DRAFT_1956892 [Cryptophyta sp. CCMP2293]